MNFVHDPGNTQSIREVFVFMSCDDQGRHGIVAKILPGLGLTPLVTSSVRTMEAMKPVAEEVARESGKRVGLWRFTRDGDPLWECEP